MPGASAWIDHAKKTFAEMKKKNPKATYSEALKAAAKTFKGKKKM